MTLASLRYARRLIQAAALAAGFAASAGAMAQAALALPGTLQTPYYRYDIDEDQLGGAPDQSSLNQPLDAGSRMFIKHARFHKAGPDGRIDTSDDERLRLFGINLSFAANFPAPEDAAGIARRLKRQGFNAVRLHHMDTSPSTATDPPVSILTPGPYPSFNDAAVARLRGFIEALAQEGIYVNLNLRVGYQFRPDVDEVPPFDASQQARPIASPIVVYHPRMVELQARFASEVIARLGLANNPALAMVEINNESGLLAAWQRREWRDAIPEQYSPELLRLWQAWLAQRYGSVEQACAAWRTCEKADEVILLTPEDAEAAESGLQVLRDKLDSQWVRLSGQRVGGRDAASDSASGKELRTRDFLLFLADTDRAYYTRIRQVIHQAAGFPVPVTGTQMGYGGILNLASHEEMDYTDEHFYVDHPHFLNGSSDVRDWRIWNVSLTGKHMDLLTGMALRRDVRKPLVVSEFNQPLPSLPAAELVPITAAYAALQDWDGLFFFDYADGSRGPAVPGSFALRGDWGKVALIGQAARLFRSGWIPANQEALVLPMPAGTQAALAASRRPDALEAHLAARHGVVEAMGWSRRIALDPAASEDTPVARPAAPAQPLRSPGGEVVYDPKQGVLGIQAPQVLGLFGRPPASPDAGGLGARFTDSDPAPHTSILLTAADAKPLADSQQLLLSLGSGTVGTQPGSHPPRPKQMVKHPSGSDSWTLEPDPQFMQRPSGSHNGSGLPWLTLNRADVSWPTRWTAAQVYPLDGQGKRMAALPASRVSIGGGRLTVSVQATPQETSPWYEIVPGPAPAAASRP